MGADVAVETNDPVGMQARKIVNPSTDLERVFSEVQRNIAS